MTFQLALTSNYVRHDGDPEPYLERMAAAGFTHTMWAHHAWSDYIYTEPEVRHFEAALKRTGVKLNDLHCPTGRDQSWGSPMEYVRRAGIELITNRIRLAERLGCDVIVMHIPMEPAEGPARQAYWDRQRRTLDALEPVARRHSVRLALENTLPGNFDTMERFFQLYAPDFLGLCYDSGHGNAKVDWPGNGLERAWQIRDRILDLHLHDNDGTDDLHWMPFDGTTDWKELARVAVASAYRKKVIPLEVGMKVKDPSPRQERDFLRQCHAVGLRLARLFENARKARAARTRS